MKPQISKELWAQWLGRLAEEEFVVIDQFLPEEILRSILHFFKEKETNDLLAAAKIGPAQDKNRNEEIRSDFTFWMDKQRDESLSGFFTLVESLLEEVARNLFLSLKGYEFHIAKYPREGFYKKHLDQFDHRSNRMLSLVIYLNEEWTEDDGGELLIHTPINHRVIPVMNRAVLFRSDTVLHEVLPSKKTRRSLTGWLLKQPSNVGVLGI